MQSTYQNQKFRAKLEVRNELDHTAMLFLTLITIEATSLKERFIGVSYFPLFMDHETKMPCIQIGEKPLTSLRSLHKGAYQMPVFNQLPPLNGRVTYAQFVQLERIPCASVLIRLDYSAIDFEGNFISIYDPDERVRNLAYEDPPKYSEGVYSTVYYLTSNLEREMFKKKVAYTGDAELSDVLEAIIEVTGGKVQRNDVAMINYFAQMMKSEDPSSLPLIELNYISTYDKNFGFHFGIGGIVGIEERGILLQCLASICPPASPYLKEEKSLEFAYPFVNLDLNCSEDAVRF